MSWAKIGTQKEFLAIAEEYDGLNADIAYVLGLLHDIGRRFGVNDLQLTIKG